MVKDDTSDSRRSGVVHLHSCNRRGVVRQQVVVGHSRVASQHHHRRQTDLGHHRHEGDGRRSVGEHQWCSQVQDHRKEPRGRMQDRGPRVGQDIHIVIDEHISQPRQSQNADRGRHSGPERRLGGELLDVLT